MKNKIIITVLMSVYKEPIEWIRLSIDSILKQTFHDFEFIIINDNPGRMENTLLLNEYAAKDSRLVIITNEINIGLTKSLNKGLLLARGEYIARMDADDISLPTRFEKQLNYLKNNPDVGAVGCNAYVINEKSEITSKMTRPSNKDYLRYLSIFESPIFHPSSFFRRFISNKAVKYDESVKYSQDYALWISLLKICNIANLEEKLLYYRKAETQISKAHYLEQQQFAFNNQLNAVFNMGLMIRDEDIECFKYLTRPIVSNRTIDSKLLRTFIVRFLKENRVKLSDSFYIVRKRLILIYANVITKKLPLTQSLFDLLKLQILTKYFNCYSILSLVNKYRIKRNLN